MRFICSCGCEFDAEYFSISKKDTQCPSCGVVCKDFRRKKR